MSPTKDRGQVAALAAAGTNGAAVEREAATLVCLVKATPEVVAALVIANLLATHAAGVVEPEAPEER